MFSVLWMMWATALAGTDSVMATGRNNATNFRDRALAYCTARAYGESPAGMDAAKSAGAFLDWTYFDLDANARVDALIETYLKRDYGSPAEGYAHVQFALLKCIDMYHSSELGELVRRYVPHPDWIGDKPPRRRQR